MDIESLLIKKLYIRNIVAGVLALILCGTVIYFSGNWKNIIFGILAVIAILYLSYSLYKDEKEGRIVAVYAKCSGTEKKKITLNKDTQTTYTFVSQSRNGREGGSSIVIKDREGKFYEDVIYCLIFRKADRINKFDEHNLLASAEIESDAVYFTTSGDSEDQGN